jgi:hypothetical protein
MLLLLPALVFGAAFLLFWEQEARQSGDLFGWGPAFLKAAVVWGALVVIFSEGLSLFRAVRAAPLALAWGAALAALLGVLVRGGGLRELWAHRRSLLPRELHLVEGILLVGLAAEFAVLFAVAWTSPPNNTDSLAYHMARVAHWAQTGALVHYPTAYEPQLTLPVWAEAAVLNLRLLWGNDRPANLVQLFSMIGLCVIVVQLARLLGASRRGQLLSAMFVASLPILVLEATSTQNDIAAGLWLACLAYWAVVEHLYGLSRLDLGLAGVCLGLALLTKGTLLIAAPAFGGWILLLRLRRRGWWSGAKEAAVVVGLAASLNLGYWSRNIQTYRMPLGSMEEVRSHTYGRFTLGGVIASWIENLTLNLATPSEGVNERIVQGVRALRPEAGEAASQFGLAWAWNNENLAGNPLHLGLATLAWFGIVALTLRKRTAELKAAATLAGVLAGSSLLFFSLLDFDLYGVRYQIPFFVAMAPIVGLAAETSLRPRVVLGASLVLLLLGSPWVLLNASRPAIGLKPRTMIDSVFDEPAPVILMANWTDLRESYFGGAQAVRESGCDQVGLRLDSHDLEYAYWWLLDAPQSGIRIENIDPPPHLQRYVDPQFRPCAIVCMVCGGRTRFHGLDRTYSDGKVSVFLGSEYTPAQD